MKLLMKNYHYICALRELLSTSQGDLDQAARFVAIIIEDHMWKGRFVKELAKTITFEVFSDFVEASPPEGLGITVNHLRRRCTNDHRTLRLIDREVNKGTMPAYAENPQDKEGMR